MSLPTPRAQKIDWSTVHERLRANERSLAEVLSPNPQRIERVLEERAARLVRRQQETREQEQTPVLILEAGEEWIAMDALAVQEVVPIRHLAPVPGTGPELLGVTTIRGELYSVLDPVASVSGNRTAPGAGAKTAWGVALRHPRLRVLLGIATMARLEMLPANALANAPENVLRVGEHLAILLDTQTVLEHLDTLA